MAKYRKRPVEVEAVQLTRVTYIHTLEGTMRGNVGDWLVTGTAGEQYPVRGDIFHEVYERVEEEVNRA